MPIKRLDAYNVILLIIIVIASILRLWRLGSVPFMHDEFSALIRTGYDNLHDLIREGVMLNDMHPAGVQLFLYFWVKLFGWNEFWLKLPFALMGIASVYLVYIIAHQWFNKNVGLLSAALVSVSQLFMLYSQLIRPYTPGLFFILLLVYFWNRILFDERKVTLWTCVGFALSAFCAAEIQMFSMAQAGLIALTGLFFFKNLEKDRRKAYLWSCVAAVILYMPSVPIFYYQFIVEGGIGWLPAPETNFIFTFVSYALNGSDLMIFTVLIVLLLPFILKMKRDKRNAIRIVSFLWFVIPFAIAYAYSLLRDPILQYSTLIFSFPFLIIAAFSFFDAKMPRKTTEIVVSMVLLIGVASLIFDRQYYQRVYQQGFDQVAVEMAKDEKQYSDSINFVAYASRSLMNEHYQKRVGFDNVKNFDQDSKIADYQYFIKNCGKNYLGVGLTDHANMDWELVAVAEYPYLVDAKTWFTTRYLTLTKSDNGHPLLQVLQENVNVNEGNEWPQSVQIPIEGNSDFDRVGFIADVQALDTINHIALVVIIDDKTTKESLFSRYFEDKNKIMMPGEVTRLTGGFFRPDIDLKNCEFKVFIWNMDKKPLIINKLSYYKAKNGPYFYGLYNPL